MKHLQRGVAEPTVPAAAGARHHEEVLRLAAAYPDLPLEAVFKEDLLRVGVQFTPAALQLAARAKPKAYFIFSFDMVPLSELPTAAQHAPEEIALVGGPHHLRRTIVSVRLNPQSPYWVDAVDERLWLHAGAQVVSEVKLGPLPPYYERTVADGKSICEVAPTIEWGYLVYLTIFRLCQYFGADEECKFCDINENFRQQRRAGRPYTQVKELDDVLAALAVIDTAEAGAGATAESGAAMQADAAAQAGATAESGAAVQADAAAQAGAAAGTAAPATGGEAQEIPNGRKEAALFLPLVRTTAYTLTGGSITSQLQGQSEVDFYCRYAEAIEARFPRRWISKVVVQAHEPEAVRRFKNAGVQILHPNYEVWDARLFEILCPGKQRLIGREAWIRRILAAAEVMGPAHVIPNFVAGVEMARPWGFATVEEALVSTAEGLEFFMSHGVVPRFTTWCPEPLSELGQHQGPAPLAYHLGLLRLWRDTHRRHRLPVPPGYGAPGAGRAVFSVSAFMDVVEV